MHLFQQDLRQIRDGLWIQLKWEKYIIRLSFSVGGEFTDDAYASRKRYIASIYFIKSQYNAKGFTIGDVVPADRLDLEPNETNREGSATFTINGINDHRGQPIRFGLEVCLDHAISTASSEMGGLIPPPTPRYNWDA